MTGSAQEVDGTVARIALLYCLVVFVLPGCTTPCGTSSTKSSNLPPDSVVVDVARIAQQGDYLCWAACGEMVMEFLKPSLNVMQCAQVNSHNKISHSQFTTTDCCKNFTPCAAKNQPVCDNDAPTPGLEFYNFKWCEKPGALTWDEVQGEIFGKGKGKPFIYEAGRHFVVAKGYYIQHNTAKTKWLVINDPWKPCKESDEWHKKYDVYRRTAERTWYNIRK